VIPVTLRNFGLPFSRRGARPDAGVTWRPRHTGIILVVVVVLILIALAKLM
jgi:hypothetical protein